MSALFKLVLGQKVVHPSVTKRNAEDNPHPNGEATINSGSSSPAVANGDKLSSKPTNGYRHPAAPNAGTTGRSAHDGTDADAGAAPSRGTVRAPKTADTTSSLAHTQRSSSPPVNSSNSPRPRTPTRTLLLRIEGCTVAQDIRDALRDLLRCPDVPYALDEASLKSILSLLPSYAEDESITEPTLQLLANATDIDAYPSELESNRRTIAVTMADKRHTCDELLQVLVNAVSVFLDAMSATAPFWSRYYAVVVLQRLEEYEPSRVHQELLAARGVSVLLDALNETENDNALRSQALLLLTSLTLTDRELQTLLAFDNAFDSLFDLIQREGGVLGGGAVVRDSLTVVHNLLRSNKATQKFFREMGCAARLAALFDSIPAELATCTVADQRRGSAPTTSRHWPQPIVLAEKLEVLLDCVKAPDVMLNILMSISILACVLRGHEDAEEEFYAIQDALLRCGLLHPLTRLAFCGMAIDDATRIEAVRVLALLLSKSKRALEEWLTSPPLVTLVRATLPYIVRTWPSPRALLSYVCETTDTTLVNAGVQLFLSTLSVPVCQERVAGVFLGDLVGSVDQASASNASGGAHASLNTVKTPPMNTTNGSSSSTGIGSQADLRCGAALARILLSSSTSAVEKYYTAQVFRTLLGLPAAVKLSESLVRAAVPAELRQGTLDTLVKGQPGWVLSPQLTPSFFNYFVSFLLFAISGGAASQQMSTAALGAYVAALLAWTGACPWAAAALVQEVSWGDTLLHQARRDGAAHLRLWSAMLIARGCVVVRAATAAACGTSAPHLTESATAAAGTALEQRFLQMVGGGAALDTILFDAQASTPAWQHPVACGLRTQTPTVYDEPFVAQVEQLAQEFKRLLSTVPGAPSLSPPSHPHSSTPLPPPPHLTPTTVAPAALAHASPPPPPYSSPNNDAQLQQLPLPPSSPNIVSSSADFHVPGSSVLSHDPPSPPSPSQAVVTGSVPVLHAGPSAETLALIESLQAQVQASQAERDGLIRAVHEWRGRAEQSEALCRTLQQAQEGHVAALEAAEAEMSKLREADAAAQASAVSPDVVDGLRENMHLLEEALNSKDEEHQQLVESLNMMEEQLRHATRAAAAANEQRAAAVAATAELQRQHQYQYQQQQEQQRVLPPPPPQGPPPEVVAAMEAERNALQQQLAEARQEAGRLQHSLQNLMADHQELLLMVAELNEECVSAKAFSSVAPTPARQPAEWLSTSPGVDRDNEAESHRGEPAINASSYLQRDAIEPDVAATATHGNEMFSSPSLVVADLAQLSGGSLSVGAEGRWRAAESPLTQLAEIARTASSTTYAAATDVLIDPAASQPSPPLPAEHLERTGNSSDPQREGLDPRTSHQHHAMQDGVQPGTQQLCLPPPPLPSTATIPAPNPHSHGRLPTPMFGRPSAAHACNRHAPRYADPSIQFFNGGGAAPQTQVPTAVPPPSMPATETAPAWSSPPSFSPQDAPPAYHVNTLTPLDARRDHQVTEDLPLLQNAENRSADNDIQPTAPPPSQVQDQLPHTHQQHEAQEVEEQLYQSGSFGNGENGVFAPQQQASTAGEAPPDAPPLPSADDFFGGGGDDEADSDVISGHAAKPAVVAQDTDNAEPSLPALAHQTRPRPPSPPPDEESAPARAVGVNPFLSNSSATHRDHAEAHVARVSSEEAANATVERHLPLPADSNNARTIATSPSRKQQDKSGSASLKSDLFRTETAVFSNAPPPPLPASTYGHHPASALSSGAHHLNYKGNALHGQQRPNPQTPPATSSHENGSAPPAATAIPPQLHGTPSASVAQATAAYNPFADFQGEGDDDDGLDGLR